MKNKCIYFIIMVSFFLSSCHWGERGSVALPMELVQAENIMYEYPDSALQILQGMTIPVEEDAKATWALLLTQAKYKCNVMQSDSLLNMAFDYFMDRENVNRKALVLYHKAALYEERNMPEEALIYFLDAAKMVENTNDYLLAHLIHVRVGILYALRGLHEYSVDYCEKALQYAELSGNTYYISNSYNNLARAYSAQDKDEQAIFYYDKAMELARIYNEVEVLNYALQEEAGLYIRMKDYQKAISLLSSIKEEQLNSAGYQIKGHLYSKMNRIDSAYYYLNKAIEANDIYIRKSAYQVLFNLSKNTNDYKKNAEYSVKLWKINDSINKIDQSKALIEMQEKYDQQKVINEKNQVERRGLMALCIVLFIAGVIVVFYQRKIYRQKEELKRMESELNNSVVELNENKQTIFKNKQRIEELNEELAQNKELTTQLEKQAQSKEQSMKQAIEKIQKESQEKDLLQASEKEKMERQQRDLQREIEEMGKRAKESDLLQASEKEELERKRSELQQSIDELERKNRTLNDDNTKLELKIEQQIATINRTSKEVEMLKSLSKENLYLHKRELFLCDELLKKNDFICKIRKNPRELDVIQWEELKKNINAIYDDYTERLQSEIPTLTEHDIYLCCLIKLSFSNSEIASFFNISSASVARQKLRLKDRILQKVGTLDEGVTLSIWLKEY